MRISLSQGKVSSLVKLELRVEFNQDKCKHKAYDKRKPGLFKVEWEGQGIVALCFKAYYCFGTKDKFSCKGINKKCNDINKDKYLQVLLSKHNSGGVNHDFRVVNNAVYTYTQV